MNLLKSKTAKLTASFVGLAMAVTIVVPAIASADTASDLQAQINSLLSTIQSLQAQLAATTGGSMTGGYTFGTNLTIGSKGTDVMNLQKVLNMSADTQVAATGPGSKGMETSTFGPLTKAAVVKFQTKNGISPAAGYVGPITRAKLNSMGGTTTTTTPGLPQGGALTVSGGLQPANSLAPKSASRVPFTNFTLTAGPNDVTINSVTVQRTGLANDAVFGGLVLLDSNGMQIGIAKTLNSNHQSMVGEPFVVKAGTSRTFTVAGNMASDLTSYVGQVASLDVVAINTSASVTGSLPITGAMQTANNSLTIGSATINTSSFDPNNGASNTIGTTGLKFSGLRITAGSAEDMTLKSIRWNQTGSVGSSDLANLVTVVNGTSYPTTVSADGKYYTTVFPGGVVITKGNSIDAYIQGDIVGSSAASRTVEFDIYKNTDLYLTGNTYGYGITAPTGSGTVSTTANHATTINTSSNPWFQGSQMSVTAGSITLIGKANEVASANIAVNVSNQVLGGFATNFSGEPVSVQGMYFILSTTTNNTATANSPFSAVTNITIVDSSGAVVAGPVDAVVGDASVHGGQTTLTSAYTLVHFTDTVTFPVGRKVYTIKGKIPSAWANGATVNMITKPSTDWSSPTGQTTGNTIDFSGQTTVTTMNTMTVKAAALAVSVSSQPTTQTIVAGIQDFTLANYILDATASGEDVRLSSFPVNVTDTTLVDVSGCQLYNAASPSISLNTGSGVKNFTTAQTGVTQTLTLDNSLVIPKGTVVTLQLRCNIASGSTNSISVNATAITAAQFTVTGQTSGNTVTPTVNSTAGAVFTLSSGSLAVSVDSSSYATTTVAAGTSNVNVGIIKFRATNEDVNLTKIGLSLTTGTTANIGTVYLYNGSTQIGTVVFPQGSAPQTATSTLTSSILLPKNTDVLLTIKTDVQPIGIGQSGVPGAPVIIDVTNAEGTGLSSGTTIQKGGVATGVLGLRTFKSFPVVNPDNGGLSTTGVLDGHLMRVKITADSHGPVSIFNLSFTLATSGAAGGGITSAKVMAFSDSAYSQPVQTTIGAATGQMGVTNGDLNGTNATLLTSNPTIRFQATTNAVPIPAGQSVYFELQGTSATGGTTFAVTSTIVGDATYITSAHLFNSSTFVSSTTGATADSANKFIWSGNSTSTSAIGAADTDWSNGFKILNLPSGGFSFTRSL